VPDPTGQVANLLLNFRLLEAAGACELIRDSANECGDPSGDIPGGQAYEAWLCAYLAVAELDAERALSSLDRCAFIAREFVDVPELERELSLYEFLQRAADTIARVVPMAEHPVRDLRRFAFVPMLLRDRYGS
jgi:hypothetical protein